MCSSARDSVFCIAQGDILCYTDNGGEIVSFIANRGILCYKSVRDVVFITKHR